MDLTDLLSRFAVALGIGLLIGLERGWKARDEQPGGRTAGFRTFSISGLLGGTAGAVALALGGVASAGGGLMLGLSFLAYAGMVTVFCLEENRAEKTFSATTAIAAILTFALGAYAMVGDLRVAAAAAIATTLILAAREQMHGWLAHITKQELRSALILLAMTFIILPVVPDDPIGPFGGVNPREIWLIAIILAGVSFLGYVAVKYFGARHGVLLASAAGGLASSTAVSVANARRAATEKASSRLLAAGVSIATAISFLRVLVIVFVLKPSLLPLIAPALVAATLVAACIPLLMVYWAPEKLGKHRDVKFKNPFRLGSVIGMAALLAVIVLAGRALGESLGATGAIIGAFAMGVADVDAVTVSMARLTPQPLAPVVAVYAILAAVVSNNLAKVAAGAAIARGAFAVEVAGVALLSIVAGGAALWLTLLMVPA